MWGDHWKNLPIIQISPTPGQLSLLPRLCSVSLLEWESRSYDAPSLRGQHLMKQTDVEGAFALLHAHAARARINRLSSDGLIFLIQFCSIPPGCERQKFSFWLTSAVMENAPVWWHCQTHLNKMNILRALRKNVLPYSRVLWCVVIGPVSLSWLEVPYEMFHRPKGCILSVHSQIGS